MSRRELTSPCFGSRCFYSQYFRLVDQRRFREQVLGLCEKGFRDVATKVCIAPVFIGERVKMPNFDGPIFNAYQVVVPVSACTNGSADFRNCSTSCSLPGFASSCTRIDNLSMFSPGTQLFRSADGQLLLIQRHKNLAARAAFR